MQHSDQHTGHCLYGDIRFKFDPDAVRFVANCHCESCRRATGSPVTTFIGVRDSGWRWLGAEPAVYESSPGVRRSFCPRCGTPVAYASESYPGEIHFYAALLIDPSALKPTEDAHSGERLDWCPMAADLPQK